jgi:Ulp1 family protease
MAKSAANSTIQCKLCELCCNSEQEFMIHRQKCLINQIMDIKSLESSIPSSLPSSLNYENTALVTELANQNVLDQRKVINEQTVAIEKQKNDIVDQATEIAEQRKQIMAMLAMYSNDNDDFFY